MKNGLLLPEGETLAEELASPDREIVERAIAGDKDAFSALFRLTYQQMFFAARKILRRDEDIYDALQIGYIKAYKYIDRLNDPDKFVPWLYRIVENAAKDVYKDVYGQSEQMLDEDVPVSDDTEETERRADIRDALATLPLEQAEVLSLYYYDGLTLAEISRLLGVKQNTVYSRLTAAKKALLKELEIRGIDRSVYGGGVFTSIAVALRSVIGTDILSATVAQKMLDNVLSGTPGRLECAAANLVARKRNRAILRIAGLLMLFCAFVTVFTTLLALWLSGNLNNTPIPSMPELPAWLWATEDESTTSATTTASSPTMVGNPTGLPGWVGVPTANGTGSSSASSQATTTPTLSGNGVTSTTTTSASPSNGTTGSTTTTTTTTTTTRSTTQPVIIGGTGNSDGVYREGSVQNGVYVNETLGIRLVLPSGWEDTTAEEADHGDTLELSLRDRRSSTASSLNTIQIVSFDVPYESLEEYISHCSHQMTPYAIGNVVFYGYKEVRTADYYYLYGGRLIRIYIYGKDATDCTALRDLFEAPHRPDLGASYQPGSIRNGVYENQSLGIRFEIPDGWVDRTEAEPYEGNGCRELLIRDYRIGEQDGSNRVYVFFNGFVAYESTENFIYRLGYDHLQPQMIGKTMFYGYFSDNCATFNYMKDGKGISIWISANSPQEVQELFARFQPL